MKLRRVIGRLFPKLKRVALVASGVLLVVSGISYARALAAPNSPGWDLRTAEWLRDSHLGWLLDAVEWAWFTVHGPSGEEALATQLSVFPRPFDRPAKATPPAEEPPPIEPVVDRPARREGEWIALGSTVDGVPALRATFFRPDRDCSDVTVAVARFTPKLTRFVLVPGTHDPGGDWRWGGAIPEAERANLLAAFNAGYRLRDAHGGIYAEGQEARPLVKGAASLVIDRDGDMDVVAWNGDGQLSSSVVAVRQNLKLLVTDGKVRVSRKGKCAKGLARSGLGITRDSALLYVVGHGLTPALLAEALQHAGALRAMQLDAHSQWQSFNIFQPAGEAARGLVATKLTPDMRLPATRYLVPDDRDFLAAFVR